MVKEYEMSRSTINRKKSLITPLFVIALSATALSACGSGSSSDNNSTSGSTDTGTTDTGTTDVGTTDTGTTDVGTTDVGTTDVGTTDVGTTDVGTTDIGTTDVGTTDIGTTDIGTTDIGTTDIGTTDIGTTDIGGTTGIGSTDGGAQQATGNVGDANCPALVGSGNVAAIAGLFDLTDVDPQFGEDIFYSSIDSAGNLVSYDYQQDEFDQGDNCYVISQGDAVLSSAGGNLYTNQYYDDPDFNCDVSSEEFSIVRANGGITVSYVDEFDDDGDGDTTETITEFFPELTGVSTQSFNACN